MVIIILKFWEKNIFQFCKKSVIMKKMIETVRNILKKYYYKIVFFYLNNFFNIPPPFFNPLRKKVIDNMKQKIFFVLAALLMLTGTSAMAQSDNTQDSETGTTLKGDVNGDGKINSLDAAWVLKHDAMIISLDDTQLDAADVNGDGKINIISKSLFFEAFLNGSNL